MKPYLLCIAFVTLAACQQRSDTSHLQVQIDSLQSKLAQTYKPGFGEFMSSIQIHHNKLWFAGQSRNWKLADFEIHEIIEAVDNIEKYQAERVESKKVGMIRPALDTVVAAIDRQSLTQFNNSYLLLTNTCNECHQATEFGFNKVKIPDTPPFSNQVFKQ